MTERPNLARRAFLLSTGSLAALSFVGCKGSPPSAQQTRADATSAGVIGRRRLGPLEVSSVGLGCQNVSRTYQNTVPNRADVVAVIRTAYDHGVTFFDTAEAYGPLEAERILGEAAAPFRDKVVITSKFGWNIDPLTGEQRPGLNSRPEHITPAVEGMLRRLRTDRIDLHHVDATPKNGPTAGPHARP